MKELFVDSIDAGGGHSNVMVPVTCLSKRVEGILPKLPSSSSSTSPVPPLSTSETAAVALGERTRVSPETAAPLVPARGWD